MGKNKVKNLAHAIMDAKERGLKEFKINGQTHNVDENWKQLEEEEFGDGRDKIDMDKDGKITGNDFKMLRNKKKGKCDECSQKMNENDDENNDVNREFKRRYRDELRDAENKLRKITPEMIDSLSEEKMMELEEIMSIYDDGVGDDIIEIIYSIGNGRYEKDGYMRISIEDDIIDIVYDRINSKGTDKNYIFVAIDDFAKFFGVDDDNDENDSYSTDEEGDEMNENKGMCSECGGMMNEGGMCNECGGTMYESKKRTLKLTESELVSLISRMVESVPGVAITKRAQKGSKKENDDYMREVKTKLKKASSFDGADNPEFPKQNGKGEKMAINATPEQDEYTALHRGGTLADLNYDQEPSENFKKRLKMALEGDPKMGNSQDTANVIKTDTGKNIDKISKKKKEIEKDAKEISWGHSWKSPEEVVIVKESKTTMSSVLNEEIERMKKMYGYDEKTQ
jgi:hypothetical protein